MNNKEELRSKITASFAEKVETLKAERRPAVRGAPVGTGAVSVLGEGAEMHGRSSKEALYHVDCKMQHCDSLQ